MIIRQGCAKLLGVLPSPPERIRALFALGSCKKHRTIWLSLLAVLTCFLIAYVVKDPVCHLVMSNSFMRTKGGRTSSFSKSSAGSRTTSSKSKTHQHTGSFPPPYGFSAYSTAMIHPRVRDVFMSDVFWKSFVATSASLLCITGGAFLAYTKITQKRRRELDKIYKKRRGDVHHMQRIRHLYGLQLDDDPYLNAQEEDTPETELENPATAET